MLGSPFESLDNRAQVFLELMLHGVDILGTKEYLENFGTPGAK